MMGRHDDLVCDPADFADAQPSLEGAPQRTSEEQALRQVLDEPQRDPNQIRAIYGLPKLKQDALDEWIAGAVEA